MSDLQQAVATQLSNIEKRSGKSLAELCAFVLASQLQKHGELVALVKAEFGLGHGDANALVHHARQSDGSSAAQGMALEDVERALYVGAKEALWPTHQAIMQAMHGLGEFEILPKKNYLSLRRKKQFAMVGPATNTRIEIGLNMKDVPGGERLLAQAPGGMCQYKIKLTTPEEVDAELLDWIKQAFAAAG